MPTTIRVASLDGTTLIELNEDKTLEQVVNEYKDRGLNLLSGGQPVTGETAVQDGATITAAPRDAKLG